MAPRRFHEPVYHPPRPIGRPRKVAPLAECGDNVGTTATEHRMNTGEHQRAEAKTTTALPRLVDLLGAAAYLAVSPWTIREWAGKGWLPRVRFLLPSGHEVRKLLFDKQDLDRMIDTAKDGPPR